MSLLVGTRRALLGGGRRIVAFDNFTDADATLLAAHAASDGGSWSKHSSSGAGDFVIASNRLSVGAAGTFHVSTHSYQPDTPDYDVEGDLILKSDNNASELTVAGRIVIGATTWYQFGYTTASNEWSLYKVVAGSATQLAAVSATLTLDLVYRTRLRMRGTTVAGYVNDVLSSSATDSAISASGRAGIRSSGAATDTTGLNFDSWRIVSP